jgi:hypothetical protein
MGARNNKALREPKNKNAKAAALNKKFKKKPCSRLHISITKISPPFASTFLIVAKSALAALQVHAHSTSVQSQLR